jgi:two-component system, chemotaxis family, CheB/CheR fusion protein
MAQRKRGGERGSNGDPAKQTKTSSTPRSVTAPAPFQGENLTPRLLVGLGASAGGLDAFRAFFANMPPQSGMAFVLVQHLDPNHKSLLVELLSGHTEMPVVQAADGMRVVAEQVFVIPPNAVLTIEAGILRVATPAPPREHRKPIDTFFASLAEDQQEKAVSIILSGSGSDGSLGLKAIKEHGGFTLAQAGFDETALLGMPSSAAATGLVDEVMPVEQMPERLLAYAQHLGRIGDRKAPDGTCRDAAEHLTRICALLRTRLGHDFSQYKQSTLVRRIQRRMQVLQIDSVPEYIERLRQEPNQLELLFRDLLIGVTRFFRDPEAFAALESEVMPKLFENKRRNDAIRVWVPGCATGEEAYSIAILVKESMIKREAAPQVQIFATDLDEQAVTTARHGRYRKPVSGVPPERIGRWFVEEGDDCCVIADIREMCVFSIHDIARDPPFSKLDLISCRNLLIYLDVPLQNRLMQTFHYALQPSGYLFLGSSEGVARQAGLFAVLDRKYRLFQRRDDVRASLPSGVLGPAPTHPSSGVVQPAQILGDGVDQRARNALEKYSPAYVVINRQHEVLRFSGRTGHYIEHSPGAASLNLFNILRKDLQPPVRAAVRKAFASRHSVVHEDLVIPINDHNNIVNLIIEPISREADAELYAVAFQDRGFVRRASTTTETAETADARVQALERELRGTRTQLQSTIDDLETANEELKSANEEYQSVNEEFQSANEELESSKEEIQSINEELTTINGELNAKNEALTEANSDIKNLLDSTEIATLFLDNVLRIKNFTPAIAEVFHVRASDRGRPITDIVSPLGYGDLERDVKAVLRTLSMIEREVATAREGQSFLMRIRPYRTVTDIIDGVVITFVDITERKRQEDARARLAAIVDSSHDAIISEDLEGIITSWNRGAEQLYGYTAQENDGRPIAVLVPPDRPDDAAELLARIRRGDRIDRYETVRRRKDGSLVQVSLTVSPVKNAEGGIIGASKIVQDITERKNAEALQALMAEELNHRVKNTLATVQSIVAQSLKENSDVETRKMLDARLVALSRTHDLLARGSWERASLRDLVLQELEPYRADDGTRFVVDGPEFGLRPNAAVVLGMVFHELATNAAKYGSLSRPAGQVRVTWDILNDSEPGMLRLNWAETGGPPVEKIARKGFGSVLIERGLSLELDGNAELEFDPSGLVCTIEIPLPTGRE